MTKLRRKFAKRRTYKKAKGLPSSCKVVFKRIVADQQTELSFVSALNISRDYPTGMGFAIPRFAANASVNTNALIPFDLAGSERELLRYVNQYQEFKIDWIKWTWSPTLKNKPRRMDAGLTDIAPVYKASDPVAYIAMPRQQAQQNAAGGPDFSKFLTDIDVNVSPPYVTNVILPNSTGFNIKKRSMYKPFSIVHKAKVMKTSIRQFYGLAGDPEDGNVTQMFAQEWRPMPYVPILDPRTMNPNNWPTDIAAPQDRVSSSFRQPLWQPYISVLDGQRTGFNNVDWYQSQTIESPRYYPELGITGKWIVTSGWSFRGKRPTTASVFTSFDELSITDSTSARFESSTGLEGG